MRVLVIGLGDIARKAYLPILSTRPDIELHLVTRDAQVLDHAAKAFHAASLHHSLADAIDGAAFDAAFVHAATEAHPALVRTLLERRIPTFVDKPLADNLAEAERLVALSERQQTLLSVGFNRRFAPSYTELRGSSANLIVMEKHRHRQPDTPRRVIFDDFIHVIDTLLFLAPGAVERQSIETQVDRGMLTAVTLMLAGRDFTAIGSMHRDSGLNEERLDAMGNGMRRSVLNISEQVHMDGTECRHRRGDWTPVGQQRGFEAMCTAFLTAVRDGGRTQADAIIATHALCEAVTLHAERSIERPLTASGTGAR
ncbi:Gfo/Idh/MocA family protein [Sphingomonas sp. 2378]|uniref:Gfo/Idh/MocA family protein n=1 Tax=Sphingomonas sp. 2378 TaxID=1219748 RepID=UPI00311ABB5B